MEKYEDIREVQKAIDGLAILNVLREYSGDDPFIPCGAEIAQLQDAITAMLQNYKQFLNAFDAGELLLDIGGTMVAANPASGASGKNAPAYKADIDTNLIYKLWKKGIPINEIARQAHCSPDTVKRRISKM